MSALSTRDRYDSETVSEDQYTMHLIKAIKKRPVLFSTHISDYNNKNKKGDAYKEIQAELAELGCSACQVQNIYKKWISLKRKFCVEYLKMLDSGGNEEKPSYRFFDQLQFLIPYCEVRSGLESVAQTKQALKRKNPERITCNQLKCEEEEQTYNVTSPTNRLAAAAILSQSKVGEARKAPSLLAVNNNNSLQALLDAAARQQQQSPDTSFLTSSESPPSCRLAYHDDGDEDHDDEAVETQASIDAAALDAIISLRTTTTASRGFSGSNSRRTPSKDDEVESSTSAAPNSDLAKFYGGRFELSAFSAKCSQNAEEQLKSSSLNQVGSSSAGCNASNAMFGRLVAHELDKLPPSMHNLVRAQILLLIANSSSNNNNSPLSASSQTASHYSYQWPSAIAFR